MILVDSRIGSRELAAPIRARGLICEKTELAFGDIAIEGNGPHGEILIGVERKRLHDMLNSIDDARYTGHQRVGMTQMYQVSFLIIEGTFKPHSESGLLMEGFAGGVFGYCRPAGRSVLYAKLRRYLFSVSLSGVHVLYTRDMEQTVFDITEIAHYFAKRWHEHTSLLEMQKLNIPTLQSKPSLIRRWAADLEGIGVVKSADAERAFKKPILLATADEMDWVRRVPGIGVKTAQSIWREIHGVKANRD